jgi:hypothetical protein
MNRSISTTVITCALSLLLTACDQQATTGSAASHPPESNSADWVDMATEDDFNSEDLERQLDNLEDEFDRAADEASSDAQKPAQPEKPSATLLEQTATVMAAHLALAVFVTAPFATVATTRGN